MAELNRGVELASQADGAPGLRPEIAREGHDLFVPSVVENEDALQRARSALPPFPS